MKLTKLQRETLFGKYNGKCAYCGCELQKGWHVDHIEPIVRSWWNGTCEKPENKRIDNCNPACASCNIMKSSESLESFRNKISGFINSLNQYSTQYKFAKRYGLVAETNIKVKFYFENIYESKTIHSFQP